MAFNKDKIQELYPEAIMFEAMKIHPSTDMQLQKACESGDYFGELKKDGYWYQFEKHEHYSYLFSRSSSKKTGLQAEKLANVPHIADALDCLPKDTILVGEVYYPGGSSKDVTTIMGCLPQKAIDRQNGSYGQIHYYLHDILMYDGVDLVSNQVDNETRYKILTKIFELHQLNKYSFLELAEAWTDSLYERVGNALAVGEEGMVIKKKTGLYEPGKRPDSNLKAKKVDFADAIIIGFEEPTKEYYGKDIENWQYWIGTDDHEYRYPIGCHHGDICAVAVTKPYYMEWYNSRIHIGAYNKDGKLEDIGVIHSGISDEMKEDMSKNPDNYLGKVCAIQCMEKDKNEHTIRHGFFKYLREDKDTKDCTIDTIF
jgi:ATP-dependent DNA ligase